MAAVRKYSEWDSEETISSMVAAFEETGNEAIRIPADEDVFNKLRDMRRELDIVFNMAEGMSPDLIEGVIRESVVPTLLEFLQIPYTGSGPLSLAECLDKARSKEIAAAHGVRTTKFQVVSWLPFRLRTDMSFPLVVKPIAEGSSIGLTQKSKVDDEKSLQVAVKSLIEDYRQPALIEEFVGGKEYTVGIVGNSVMPVMMIDLGKMPNDPWLRDQDVKDAEPNYVCMSNPGREDAALSLAPFGDLYAELVEMAVTAHRALRCRDYNRLDLREKNGTPYLLELNPLPGMHPIEADLTVMAAAAGINYPSLVNMVLLSAISRYSADPRFASRFDPKRIRRIVERVETTMSRVRCHPLKLEVDGLVHRVLKNAPHQSPRQLP